MQWCKGSSHHPTALGGERHVVGAGQAAAVPTMPSAFWVHGNALPQALPFLASAPSEPEAH